MSKFSNWGYPVELNINAGGYEGLGFVVKGYSLSELKEYLKGNFSKLGGSPLLESLECIISPNGLTYLARPSHSIVCQSVVRYNDEAVYRSFSNTWFFEEMLCSSSCVLVWVSVQKCFDVSIVTDEQKEVLDWLSGRYISLYLRGCSSEVKDYFYEEHENWG